MRFGTISKLLKNNKLNKHFLKEKLITFMFRRILKKLFWGLKDPELNFVHGLKDVELNYGLKGPELNPVDPGIRCDHRVGCDKKKPGFVSFFCL